jgi:NAD-dependent SIR2 family protein deacetylase
MTKTKNNDILGPDGAIEARTCVDCGETKKFEEFQRTPKAGNRSSDCKACRRKKFEAGMHARGFTNAKPGTREWVIEQATLLFNRSQRDNDKAKFLDIISRNLSNESKNLTDDAKIIRDLMASKKKVQAP